MDHVNFFEDMFESITDYRKIVLLTFSMQKDENLIKEIGFSKNDNNLLNLQFKNILLEGHEEYLDNIENEKESIIERIFNK